jgi:hypothetical protein
MQQASGGDTFHAALTKKLAPPGEPGARPVKEACCCPDGSNPPNQRNLSASRRKCAGSETRGLRPAPWLTTDQAAAPILRSPPISEPRKTSELLRPRPKPSTTVSWSTACRSTATTPCNRCWLSPDERAAEGVTLFSQLFAHRDFLRRSALFYAGQTFGIEFLHRSPVSLDRGIDRVGPHDDTASPASP